MEQSLGVHDCATGQAALVGVQEPMLMARRQPGHRAGQRMPDGRHLLRCLSQGSIAAGLHLSPSLCLRSCQLLRCCLLHSIPMRWHQMAPIKGLYTILPPA